MNNLRNILLILICLLCCNTIHAQQDYKHKSINWGFRVGLNALAPLSFDSYWANEKLQSKSINTKVGYTVTGFSRINLDQFFFQPEIGWNLYREELPIDYPAGEGSQYESTDVNIRFQSANLGMLVGYNIIQNGPYLFNFMLGASFKYNYSTFYNIPEFTKFTDNNIDYTYLGIVGVSFSMYKVYFDIRYELNFPNTHLNFSDINQMPEQLKPISVDKNENILSFSVGFIF